jgi:hypothetical protein
MYGYVNTFRDTIYMNKKMGRPKLETGKARTVFISTRLSVSENGEIQKAVKSSGTPKTEWVRNSLLSSARKRDT